MEDNIILDDKATTIQISIQNWNRLNRIKNFGETFNDVITKLLAHVSEKPHIF